MFVQLMPIFVLVAAFWALHRYHLSVIKIREEKKYGKQRQEQATAPAATVAATPKGPGIMYRSTLLFFKGIKWIAPRLVAGAKKVSRFTFMVSKAGAKAAVGKYQAYRANKVAAAKAAATTVVSVNPEVDWSQYDEPAYQRVKSTSAGQNNHLIH